MNIQTSQEVNQQANQHNIGQQQIQIQINIDSPTYQRYGPNLSFGPVPPTARPHRGRSRTPNRAPQTPVETSGPQAKPRPAGLTLPCSFQYKQQQKQRRQPQSRLRHRGYSKLNQQNNQCPLHRQPVRRDQATTLRHCALSSPTTTSMMITRQHSETNTGMARAQQGAQYQHSAKHTKHT